MKLNDLFYFKISNQVHDRKLKGGVFLLIECYRCNEFSVYTNLICYVRRRCISIILLNYYDVNLWSDTSINEKLWNSLLVFKRLPGKDILRVTAVNDGFVAVSFYLKGTLNE